MTEQQLYAVLAESRIETALLITEEMREIYYSAKEHEISFAKREEVAKLIGELGGAYSFIQAAYATALAGQGSAIDSLNTFLSEHLGEENQGK